jgi:hypothetical protein
MRRMDERELLAAYRALCANVARENRRLAQTGERPTQRHLRRARLVLEIDRRTFRELARELVAAYTSEAGPGSDSPR